MKKLRLVDGLYAFISLWCVLAGLTASSPAWALGYTFTDLTPLDGARSSQVLGINNVGQVVGYSSFDPACFGCGGTTRATQWNGAIPTQLGVFGTSGYAYSINDVGQVAGYEHFSYNSYYDAILWNSGVPTQLTTLYGGESAAYAINNMGQVAGVSKTSSDTGSGTVWNPSAATTYLTNSSTAHDINDTGQVAGNIDSLATVWNGTTPTFLDSLGGGYSEAQAINNAGQVVGFSLTASPGAYHATLWNGTTATDLDTLGGHSYAHDINDIGEIVGESYTVDGVAHAVLWDGASLIDLNMLLDSDTVNAGWVLSSAQGINNQGWIAGVAVNTISNATHGFLLTPVPLPGAVWLFVSGLLGLIPTAKRMKVG